MVQLCVLCLTFVGSQFDRWRGRGKPRLALPAWIGHQCRPTTDD